MKKYRFPKKKNYFKFFLNLAINLLLSLLMIFIIFFVGELYFRNFYKNSTKIPPTVMDLSIYKKSNYRTWNHLPFAENDYLNTKIKINSLGLRNKEINLKADPKKTRVLFLGDSFVFGMGVEEKEAFPQMVQSFFGNKYVEVINAGVIGQSIDDAFLYLKNEGINLNPDIVVFNTYVANDVTELKRHSFEKNEKGEIIKVVDNLLEVDEENKLRKKNQILPESKFFYFLKQKILLLQRKYHQNLIEDKSYTLTWPIFLDKNNPSYDPNLNKYLISYAEILKQLKTYCDKNKIKLALNIIPMDIQVSPEKYQKKYLGHPLKKEDFKKNRPQKIISDYAKKNNLPVLDLLPYLKEEEKNKNMNFYFDNDPHFNKYGHRFAGAYIYKFLSDTFF
jgi:lysophospholipase L1-like esterase